MMGEGGECFDWVGVDGVSVSEGRGEWLREKIRLLAFLQEKLGAEAGERALV